MARPLTSRARAPVSPGGRRHARPPRGAARMLPPPLRGPELQALRHWLTGRSALPPARAGELLERALARFQLAAEPGLHCRAVKARLAGDGNWADMGLRVARD